MPVNDGFRDFVLEQLARHLPDVRARAMFGGVSISSGGATFALLDGDLLYLKGDGRCRGQYEEAGWPPFRPFGPDGSAMAYFQVPGEMLDVPEELGPWVALAMGAARRARRSTPRGR